MVPRVSHRIGRSLRLRVALSIACLVAIVGSAIAYVGAQLLEDALIEAEIESTTRVASHLAAEYDAAHTADPDRFLRDATSHVDGVVGAAVYDANDAMPGWSRRAVMGDDGVPVVLTGAPNEEPPRILRTSAGCEVLIVTAVAPDGHTALRIVRSLDEADAVEDRAQLVLLALALVMVAVGGLFGDRLALHWLRPLRALLDAMRDVTNGRFRCRLDTTHQDELGVLARRFNMMARALERHREEAESHANQLEQHVQQRTRELERANRALRSLDRAKDAFLSNVSHEMRTPLTSILASVEILRKFENDDPEARQEFLQIVDAESNRLLELIDGVLEIVALEATPVVLVRDEHHVRELAEAAIEEIRERADRRGVTVLFRASGDDPIVTCDAERVAQVLDGLLDNAVKFSPLGATVELRVVTGADTVSIRVRDEGSGLDPDDVEQVFAKFGQVGRSLTDKPSGFGLGLPLARKIVEAHGGTIRYEREAGFGATFVLTLPRHQPAPTAEIPAAEPQPIESRDALESVVV